MELRLAGMDDLPQLRVVFKEIIEPMIRNNVRIWDGIYNEVIADDMVLHEFGFEIPVPIYGSGNDCNKIKKILEG